ncbi:MAG: right-handed parallel beta-helix repeat-containing protein, partial [Candidatus Thermoplasmatota archaeon]|nr:right-handed parallel beta-helix repeat-containing protein [Candidatus Thermoplasmatota archaeon]
MKEGKRLKITNEVREMWKKLFPCMLIILISLLVLAINPHVHGEENDNEFITIWDDETVGKITSLSYNSYGSFTGSRDVGFADGNGNFYITSYDVGPNETLVIRPGVTIYFKGFTRNQLFILGTLKAEGTKDSPVKFTSNSSDPTIGSWGTLDKFGEKGSIELKHCIIEYGDVDARNDLVMENCIFHESFGASAGAGAVHGEKCDVIIKNCTFKSSDDFNSLHGITASNAGSFVFENNIIEGNYSYLATQSDYFKLVGNQIRDDCLVMLKSTSSQVVEFNDNTIRDSSVFLWGNFTLSGCDIVNEKDWYFLN